MNLLVVRYLMCFFTPHLGEERNGKDEDQATC